MGFSCGIVGLPNVGKSTLFNALSNGHVPAENYPFCTTDHNTGVITVPDIRLTDITKIFKPERSVPTTIEFIDIAGLVKNAHKGEGLGNKFLGHIREVDAIGHVIRCFEGSDVVHSFGDLNPARDAEVVNTELMLSDLEIIERKIEKTNHLLRTGSKEAKKELDVYLKIKTTLDSGKFASNADLTDEEFELIKDLALITIKPMFYIANIGEKDLNKSTPLLDLLKKYAESENRQVAIICGKLESELSELSNEERAEFAHELGEEHSSLEDVIKTGYNILNLISFFTKDGSEVRAWTVKKNTKAPKAVSQIHSDFENKFIRAEVYNYNDLMKFGNEHELKNHGKIRVEGRDYIVQDGDIIHIRIGN